MRVLVIFLVCACVVSLGDCARILMIPAGNTSHFNEMDGVGRYLVQRGHEVHVLLGSKTQIPQRGANVGYRKLEFFEDEPMILSKEMEESMVQEGFRAMRKLNEKFNKKCRAMTEDDSLYERAKQLNFDLALVDNMDGMVPCPFVFAARVNLKYIAFGSFVTAGAMRIPYLPSVQKTIIGLEAMYRTELCPSGQEERHPIRCSTFARRLLNLLDYILMESIFPLKAQKFDDGHGNPLDFRSLSEQSAMFLVAREYLLEENKLPELPHVKYVGAISAVPPKPITDSSILSFIQAIPAQKHLVVVSFGSNFKSLTAKLVQKLFLAFEQVPHFFIMRLARDSEQATPPSNLLTVDWLPQNDLLAYNKTKLFVTHSGNNGQYEALQYGVPMLAFFLLADQFQNAVRVHNKAYGIKMDLQNFEVAQLVAAVNELLDNRTYRDSIQKAATILRSQKPPGERAADAVEHVLKFGADHLRPAEAYSMSIAEFYMLDVIALVYTAATLFLLAFYKLLRCFCCHRKSKS